MRTATRDSFHLCFPLNSEPLRVHTSVTAQLTAATLDLTSSLLCMHVYFTLLGEPLRCGLFDPSAPAPLVALEAAAEAVDAWGACTQS